MNGGYYWQAIPAACQPADDIRPVAMCVDDVYVLGANDLPDQSVLSEVAATPNGEGGDLHIGTGQRGKKALPFARRREGWRHDYPMPRTALRLGERRDDGLESPYRSGGEQMQNGERRGQCSRDGRIRVAEQMSAPSIDGATSRIVPSEGTARARWVP